jgi:formylglycine-generating enzyme required for sulfatase activity
MNAVQVVRIIRFGNSYMKLMNAAGIIACAAALMFAPLNQQANAQCLADVNHDNYVNGSDLTAILSTWGTNGGSAGGDINSDGTVNGLDLAFVLSGWGVCPGPTWATVLEWAPDAAVVTDANLRAAIVSSGFAWRVRDNAANIEMLLVPVGTFTMGCSPSTSFACIPTESPTHQVTLTQAFYMGRYEVTQAQWTAKIGSNPSSFVPANGYSSDTTKPVESVSWNMIASGSTSFMYLTGLRLPTEAEWEYAYRAGTTTAFHSFPGYTSGTNDDTLLGNIAWYSANAGNQTHAVGGKLANGLGLHDMSGNVWEWCQDWYGPYSSVSVTNPTGPTTGSYGLLRGGGTIYGSSNCRASRRGVDAPGLISDAVGFRVVRAP